MINYYRLFNRAEFLATGLTSKSVKVDFVGLEVKDVLITKGNSVGVTIDDVFLTCELNDKNPTRLDDRIIYVDENEDVWWGIVSAD